jgi:hypothetical protein
MRTIFPSTRKRAVLRVLRKLNLVLFGFVFIPSVSSAQLYLDLPVQFDFYRTAQKDLDFSRRGVIVNPTIGFTINDLDSSKFDLSIGLGFFYSKFSQKVADRDFDYNRYGLLVSFQAYYNVTNTLRVGLGLSQSLHFTQIGDPIKLDVYSGNERDDRLGSGFRPYNIGNSLEIRYEFYRNASIGSKFTYWYIPQLNYRVIGDFGKFLDPRTDLYFSRLEFSVRVDFNK